MRIYVSGNAVTYLGQMENETVKRGRVTGIVDLTGTNKLGWKGVKVVVNFQGEIYIVENPDWIILETNDGVFICLEDTATWSPENLNLKDYDLYKYPNKHLLI